MAYHEMHHPYGQGGMPAQDPYDPNRIAYNAPPSQFPPAGPPGTAPPQPGAFYGSPAPNQQSPSAYGSPQQPNLAQSPQFAYDAGSSAAMGAPADPNMAGLASQMGGLGIAGDGGARTHRKKHRHAFHDISGGDAAPPQPYSAAPQGAPAQFMNPGLGQMPQQMPPAVGPQQPSPAGIPQPSFPGTSSGTVPTQGKVDPEQIPSIPRSRDIPAQYYFSHVFPTMERHIPPPAAIPFVAHDQGNSSPKYARLTLNNIPSTSDFLSSTALPLGMTLQPLARPDPGEQPIPVLDFGDMGPPRCRRCRAYINPFMSFRAGGNKFVCNMCTFPNDVPPEYFAPVEMTGARVDRLQRPELMMGTVEFLVPKEYWNKEPVGLQWLFLIDVSQESVTRGFLRGVCRGIMDALYGTGDEEPEDESTPRKIPEGSKIGIVTFDREVHFYNLNVCSDLAKTECSAYSALGTTQPSADDGDDGLGRTLRTIE